MENQVSVILHPEVFTSDWKAKYKLLPSIDPIIWTSCTRMSSGNPILLLCYSYILLMSSFSLWPYVTILPSLLPSPEKSKQHKEIFVGKYFSKKIASVRFEPNPCMYTTQVSCFVFCAKKSDTFNFSLYLLYTSESTKS